MGVAVEGLRELVRDLQKVSTDVVDDLKDVFAAISAKGAEIAAKNAPSVSGALRASIRGNRAKGKAVVMAGRARVPYAGAINYGWKARGIKPSYYMQRVDDVMETEAPEMFEQGISTILDKIGFDQ